MKGSMANDTIVEESDEDVNVPSDEDCEKSITKEERASLL